MALYKASTDEQKTKFYIMILILSHILFLASVKKTLWLNNKKSSASKTVHVKHNVAILQRSLYFFLLLTGPTDALQSTSSITTTKWSTGGETHNATSLVKRRRERESVCVLQCSRSCGCWGTGPRCTEKRRAKKSKMECGISIWKRKRASQSLPRE